MKRIMCLYIQPRMQPEPPPPEPPGHDHPACGKPIAGEPPQTLNPKPYTPNETPGTLPVPNEPPSPRFAPKASYPQLATPNPPPAAPNAFPFVASSLRRSVASSKIATAKRTQIQADEHRKPAIPLPLDRLAVWANCLSPIVQPTPPDSLLLDVTGCERLFRGESNLLRLAVEGIQAQGFAVRAAIADTVGAAWAIAHGCECSTIVPPGRTSGALASLSPWTLRLSEREVFILTAVGVRKIEAMMQIPRASIASRLGDGVLHRLDQALGHAPELIDAYRPPAEPVSRIRFAGATDRIEVIHEAIDRLLALFCDQLCRRAIGVRQLLCTLYHEDAGPTTLEITLSQPTRSVRHLRSLLVARLEAAPLTAPVFAAMLWTRAAETLGDRQGHLFDPADGQADGDPDEDLAHLLDRLSNRLGFDAVVRPRLVADHQPECACRFQPVIADRSSAPEASPPAATDRPLRLLARPIEVPAMAIVPDGPPTWFRWAGREHVIAKAVGPERIETGWWRGGDIQRDYFAVTTNTQRRFWLFRDRKEGKWFLQGAFE